MGVSKLVDNMLLSSELGLKKEINIGTRMLFIKGLFAFHIYYGPIIMLILICYLTYPYNMRQFLVLPLCLMITCARRGTSTNGNRITFVF